MTGVCVGGGLRLFRCRASLRRRVQHEDDDSRCGRRFLLSVSRALVRQAVGSDGCCATAACCSLLEHQDAAGGRGGDVGDGVSASFPARFPVRVGFWCSSRGWPVVGACNRTCSSLVRPECSRRAESVVVVVARLAFWTPVLWSIFVCTPIPGASVPCARYCFLFGCIAGIVSRCRRSSLARFSSSPGGP